MTSFISDTVATDFGVNELKGVTCRFYIESFDPSGFSRYQIYLPENIRSAVRKRQAEFLAGRRCASLALKSAGLLEPYTVEIGKSREPIWPQGVVGSIAHSSKRAASIVGSSTTFSGVGIDVENTIDEGVYKQINSHVLNDAERDLISAAQPNEAILFTCIFAVKEAFYKAVFPQVGIYLGFDTITVTSLPEEVSGVVTFVLNRDLSAEYSKDREFTAHVFRYDDAEIGALVTIPKKGPH